MAFNIGELQGTLTLTDNVGDTTDAVLGTIRDLASKGAKASKSAGKAIGDALKVDTTSVSKALDGIAKTLDQQTGAVTKNTRAWAANEIGADKLKDLEKLGVSTRDYIDAVTGVPAAQARMQAALAGNTAELRDLDKLTTAVIQAQSKLATEARAVGSGMDDAGDGAKQFGDGLKGLNGTLDGVVDKVQELAAGGKAAALTAGAAIGAGLALAIAAAFEADTVTRKIRATLGATEEEAGKYGAAAGKLFASNYGESLDDAGAAVTSVVKNMQGLGDASTEVLTSIAGQVISVASVFEEDFNAVTRSAGQLMKTGLAANAQEALDIVAAGFQSPVNAADDLLDTIDEYSTIFRSLGLDGKDALGLLSQGLQSGARDADTVADSLKEMLLRLQAGDSKQAIQDLGLNFEAAGLAMSRGGDSARATTDLIIDRLNQVKDPAEKSAIALGLFGTKAEDMQAALAGLDVSSAATEFETAFGKIAGSATELDATIGGGLAASFDGVKRAAGGFISEVGSTLAPALTVAAGGVKVLFDLLLGALNWLGDLPGPLILIGGAVAVWASWGTIAAGAHALAAGLLAISGAAKAAIASIGPIGVLLVAAGTAMAFLMDTSDGVEEALQAQNQYYETLAATLDSATGAITENTAATIKKQAIDNGMADTLRDAGISLETYTQAALGNKGAQEELAAGIEKARTAALTSGGAFSGLGEVMAGAAVSQEELSAALTSGDWSGVTAKVQAYADNQGRLSGQVGTTTSIMDQFTAAMSASGGPVSALDTIMLSAGATAQELATAQADAAAMTAGTGEAASAAYDNLLALATVGGYGADQIQRMGEAAGLTAPQITAIQEAADTAAGSTSLLSEALVDGGSAAGEMDTAVQLLQLALDTLAGNEISAEQASRAHGAVIRETAAATRDHAEAQADLAVKQQELTDLQATGTATTAELEAAQRAVADATDGVAAASDKQKDSLDDLANSAQGMTSRAFEGAGGMKNYDAAVAAATQTMKNQRKQFIDSAIAAGYGEDAANDLANAQGLIPDDVRTAYAAIGVQQAKEGAHQVKDGVDSVPFSKTTSLFVNDAASGILGGIRSAIGGIPDTKTIYVTAVVGQTIGAAANAVLGAFGNTGGQVRGLMGFAAGGQVPGTPPADPRADNVLASAMGRPIMLRSREWIQPEEAVDYYGARMMRDIQARRFPKPQGYAAGGNPGGAATGSGPGPWALNANIYVGGEVIRDVVRIELADGFDTYTREINA